MSLARWLAEGADPALMSPEEVRRLQNALGVREEQAIARAHRGDRASEIDVKL